MWVSWRCGQYNPRTPVNALALARSCCGFVIAALLPLAATAGVRFDFTADVNGAYAYGGRMTADGTSSRTDITSGTHPFFNPNFSIITRDEGRQLVILDHARRTFFNRNGDLISGHLGATRGLGPSSAHKPKVRSFRDGDEQVVRAEYTVTMTVEGEKLEAAIALDARFVLADAGLRALPWGLNYAAKTGYDDVDRVIAMHVPKRVPLRQVVKASRRIGDGPVITETITTTVTNVVSGEVGADVFAVPAGYRYEEPSFVY
jgi:hypothetical protein